MVSSLRGPFFLIYKPTPQQRFGDLKTNVWGCARLCAERLCLSVRPFFEIEEAAPPAI